MADIQVHVDLDGRTRRIGSAILERVATVTARWRDTAAAVGGRPAEIRRMASAFDHDDLERALAL